MPRLIPASPIAIAAALFAGAANAADIVVAWRGDRLAIKRLHAKIAARYAAF
jgi:hypothetical protein